jgi:hypothetical protein
MGYMSIIHLYKMPEFFTEFADQQICCMEKVHGTSAWLAYDSSKGLTTHPGGERLDNFRKLFDLEEISQKLEHLTKTKNWIQIKVHGECYGSKQQKMSITYGTTLRFVVFDVKIRDAIGERFLPLMDAVAITQTLNIDFVPYEIGPNTPEWIQQQTDLPSVQAQRNGCGTDKLREGVVVKTLDETPMKDGSRAIAKHKCGPFWETRRPGQLQFGQSLKEHKSLDEKLSRYESAKEVALNWVTERRAEHVMDKMLHGRQDEEKILTLKDINLFINNMLADVKKESGGEIDWVMASESFGSEPSETYRSLLESLIRKEAGRIFKNIVPTN